MSVAAVPTRRSCRALAVTVGRAAGLRGRDVHRGLSGPFSGAISAKDPAGSSNSACRSGRERTHLVALVRAGVRFERGHLVELPAGAA
jgi:hypothetical protein